MLSGSGFCIPTCASVGVVIIAISTNKPHWYVSVEEVD
jgi:hypothetical protein